MTKTELFVKLLIHIVTFVQLSHTKEIQPQISVKCSLDDSVCLTTQAQNTLQAFVEGIPELGIKKVDQLLVDPVIVETGNFSFAWTNIIVGGLRNAVIDEVSINMDLKVMRVAFHTTMLMEFDYVCDGILLSLLHVFGDGKGKITLNNTQMEILFLFDIIKNDDGNDVMHLKTYYYGFDAVDGVHFDFENVFNGDTKRSEMLNKFLNQNWKTIMANFGGYFNRKTTDKIFDAVKIYMKSRPLKDLALY